MALPTSPGTVWASTVDEMTSRLFGREDYELYEDDGEYVLTLELPGFTAEEIDVAWHEGRLNVAAEHDEAGQSRTYHRTFRFPKEVDEDDIAAEYNSGVLEVTLPIAGPSISGTPIDVE